MYVCGPTVYQRIHVGNARPFVVSMWLRRWLARQGYDVILVENITDINDKIYDAAAAQQIPSAELAEQAAAWYVQDTDLLGLGRPDHEPKASETVGRIIALIDELVERGLAYSVDGDVYFRVASYGEYGRLSGQRPDQVSSWGRRSRSTAVGSTSCSPTTRTSSRSRAAPAGSSPPSGCTTGWFASRARRCRNPSGTSSRSATASSSGAARRCSSSS
jgi:hypothetical protein